jgi:hypothetical protein
VRILAALLFTFAMALAPLAPAQDLPLRVGRIAHIEGLASVYQDSEYGWEKAYINTPITSENSVWTDQGSRAELRISGMAIRLDRLTQFDVARLDEDELDAFVARGSVALRVRHYEKSERLTFNTPNARVRIRQDGRYRIDVDPDRLETRVTVFAGEARIGTEDGRIRVGPGRSVVVFGNPAEFYEQGAASDGFDRWVLTRDERWREGRSTNYVSTYMTGYEDLDMYGEWRQEPEYGALWYPRQVSAGWAPYRYGRWDYVRPWGWTWIDDAPWGYAPSHYGRWVYVRDRWGWHPGERVARPVWAPALVAWVGGANWSAGVSSGGPSVGWYPLSPWDRYEPWFQASPAYVQRVNVVVREAPQRDDRRRWRETTRERGFTVADRRVLVEQRPVQQALIRVPVEQMRQAQVVSRPEAMLPSRNDVLARRRKQPPPAVATPVAPPAVAQPTAPRQSGERPQQQAPAARSAIVRPDFGRNAVVATPRQSSAPPEERGNSPLARERGQREQQQKAQEGAQREQQQAQERAQREQQQAQERAQREQQQAQERAQREQQQAQQKAQREQEQGQRNALERNQREQQQAQQKAQREQQQAQERAQREQQQAQERAQREQQQAQQKAQREKEEAQRNALERNQREQQQAQEKAQREQQQQAQRQQEQAQRQALERAQREQQQAQEKAQREQQQAQQKAQREQEQAQRNALERNQREQQQAQERAQREQQQAQQKAQREQQQALERAQREQQKAQPPQPPAAPPQVQPPPAPPAQAQPPQAPPRQRGDKDDDDNKGKGKGKDKDKDKD